MLAYLGRIDGMVAKPPIARRGRMAFVRRRCVHYQKIVLLLLLFLASYWRPASVHVGPRLCEYDLSDSCRYVAR